MYVSIEISIVSSVTVRLVNILQKKLGNFIGNLSCNFVATQVARRETLDLGH